MVKQTIICDRCGKEIEEGQKIGYVAINQRASHHGDLLNNNEFEAADFCEDCLIKITRFVASNESDKLSGKKSSDRTDVENVAAGDKADNDMAAVEPAQRKHIDHGKIKALSDAGWSCKEIAEEMGMTVQAVYDSKYRLKKGGKA